MLAGTKAPRHSQFTRRSIVTADMHDYAPPLLKGMLTERDEEAPRASTPDTKAPPDQPKPTNAHQNLSMLHSPAHLSKRRRCAEEDDGPRHLGASSDNKTHGALDRKFEGKKSEPSVAAPRGGVSQKQESATARETSRFSSEAPSNDARIMDIENIAQAMCLLPVSRQAGESPTPSAGVEKREQDRDTSKARSTGPGHHADRPGNDATPTSMSAKVVANRQSSLRTLQAMGFTQEPSYDGTKMPQSRFKGCYYVLGGRWESKITFKSKTRHIGTFDSEIEAALAFDAKAYELGVPQRCNFVYDEAGNLISEDPQGGARRARNRMICRSLPVRARRSHVPILPQPPPHHVHRDDGYGHGVPLPQYDGGGRAPSSWAYHAPWRVMQMPAVIPRSMPPDPWSNQATGMPRNYQDYNAGGKSVMVANGDQWHSIQRNAYYGESDYQQEHSGSQTFLI